MTNNEFGEVAQDNGIPFEIEIGCSDVTIRLDGQDITSAYCRFSESCPEDSDTEFWTVLHAAGIEEMQDMPCEFGEFQD